MQPITFSNGLHKNVALSYPSATHVLGPSGRAVRVSERYILRGHRPLAGCQDQYKSNFQVWDFFIRTFFVRTILEALLFFERGAFEEFSPQSGRGQYQRLQRWYRISNKDEKYFSDAEKTESSDSYFPLPPWGKNDDCLIGCRDVYFLFCWHSFRKTFIWSTNT